MKRALLLVTAWLAISLHAAIQKPLQSPVTGSVNVGAAPVLQWMPTGENLLENGGFEDGTTGWDTSGEVRVERNIEIAAEGERYLWFNGNGRLERDLTIPAGPGRKLLTFRTRNTHLSLSAQIFPNTGGNELEFINLRYQGNPPNSMEVAHWVPSIIDLTRYSGQTIRLHVHFERTGAKYADDFRLVVVPETATHRVYVNDRLLGETTGFTWPLNVAPTQAYTWRIAPVINGDVVGEGTIFRFTTATMQSPTRLLVNQPLPRVCPSDPIGFQVIAITDSGFTNTLGARTVSVTALGANAEIQPTISEVSTIAPGVLTGTVIFPNAPDTVKLVARATGATVLTGESAWFELLPQGRCVELLVAETAGESDGEITATLRIEEPVGSDLEVSLSTSQPEAATVPQRIILPARANEVTFPITIHNNQLLTGSRVVRIRADVPGQSSSLANLRITDDERATILVQGPSTVQEGGSRLFTMISGDPNRLIVFRENENISYADIAFYENGQEVSSARSETLWGQISVGQSEDGSRFYVAGRGENVDWYALSQNNEIGRVKTSPAPPVRQWANARPGDAIFAENRFVTTYGTLFDARNGIHFGRVHESDQSYAVSTYDARTGSIGTLIAVPPNDYFFWLTDARTLRERKQTRLPELGQAESIAAAGEKGWIVIEDGNFRIVPDPEGAPAANADLRMSLELTEHPSAPRVARARLVVENAGPDRAENTTLAITLPPGMTLLNTPEGTTRLSDKISYPHGLGTIPPGERRAYDFDFTRATTGELQIGFWLGSDAHEIQRGDNNIWFDRHVTVDETAAAPQFTNFSLEPNGSLRMRYRGQAGWRYMLYSGSLAENRPLSFIDEQRPATEDGEFVVLPADGHYFFLRREP